MIPSSKQGGAGDRPEGRQPAMGIWIIHSAHFINIIMEETERERGAMQGQKERGIARQMAGLWVERASAEVDFGKEMHYSGENKRVLRGQRKTEACRII